MSCIAENYQLSVFFELQTNQSSTGNDFLVARGWRNDGPDLGVTYGSKNAYLGMAQRRELNVITISTLSSSNSTFALLAAVNRMFLRVHSLSNLLKPSSSMKKTIFRLRHTSQRQFRCNRLASAISHNCSYQYVIQCKFYDNI